MSTSPTSSFYIHQFTNRVEQFRSLVRFMWPFYYAFNIWIIYTLIAVYTAYGRNIKIAIDAGVVFLWGGRTV